MNNQVNKEELSLKELIEKSAAWFTYFMTQWKIIVLAGFLGAVLGLTFSFIKKPVYTASLSFALEDDDLGGFGGALGLASSFGFDLGGSGGGIFAGSNLIELFKSRKMIEQTLLTPVKVNGKTISLAEMYIEHKKWREKWSSKPKFKSIQFIPNSKRRGFTRVHDSILGKISDEISKKCLTVVQRDKKVDIISMDVSSKSELFSKNFCDALAKQVSTFYIETKTKKARANMAILQKQTDSIRLELNRSITGVAVANDNTFGLNPSLNVRRTPSARRQVDVQANTAILTELVKQTELAKITLRKETPLIQVIDRPILPLKNNKIGKIAGMFLGSFLGVFIFVAGAAVRKYYAENVG